MKQKIPCRAYISRHLVICNLKHLQDGNTKVKFILRILEKIHVGFETNCKKNPDPDRKKSFLIHNTGNKESAPNVSAFITCA
jgi:hypothetical protein